MNELLDVSSGTLGLVITLVIAVNFVLSGLAKALEVVKDKTESQADNEAHAKLLKVIEVLTRVLDWIAPRTRVK